VVDWMDEGMVLLQGTLASLPTRREIHPCSCLHMSTIKFCTKPSYDCFGEDLSDGAFVWASKCIGARDVVEEFMSCGVWPLAAAVNFEQVKVGLTPISKLKVPLPRFPLSHEDDVKFLTRVE
jgi:hypothetical protein